MARFRPFRGIRYAPEKAGDMQTVVAPPYDVIAPDARDAMLAANPLSVTRLILNPDGHDEAARTFNEWLADGTLRRDDAPAFYLYAQEFEASGPRRRVGVLGALHLEPFSTGVVLRHETTFAHHKQDRLELTRRARANLSPIFGVFSNPEFDPRPDQGWESDADIDVVHDGVRHRVWTIRDAASIESIRAAIAERKIYIADGHHRYETALNYWAERAPGETLPQGDAAPDDDAAPHAHVMAFLAATEDPGMVILPTHREVLDSGGADHATWEAAMADGFELRTFDTGEQGRKALLDSLAAAGPETHAFAVALRDRPHHLLLTKAVDGEDASPLAALDVTQLHDELLGRSLERAGGKTPELAYSIDGDALLVRVEEGSLEAAFVMNATRAEQMAAVCEAGELMPQKSTYFFPKLLTGLAFHSLG